MKRAVQEILGLDYQAIMWVKNSLVELHDGG